MTKLELNLESELEYILAKQEAITTKMNELEESSPLVREYKYLLGELDGIKQELPKLKKEVSNLRYANCSHVFVDVLDHHLPGSNTYHPICLKCGEWARLYDPNKEKKVYYTGIKGEYEILLEEYHRVLESNPDMDEEHIIELLKNKMNTIPSTLGEVTPKPKVPRLIPNIIRRKKQ